MSKHDFRGAEFADRVNRTREAIGAAGLDCVLAFVDPLHIRSEAGPPGEIEC